MKNVERKSLCFDDVLLVPKYSDIVSRSEIDISTKLSNVRLKIPIISSPMDTVTEDKTALEMDRHGGLGIIHRYNSVLEQAILVEKAASDSTLDNVGAAIGVSGDYLDRAKSTFEAGANIICVDIAHGHHVLMERALKNIRDKFGEMFHIVAGNVATKAGYEDLVRWGADSVRVGIGGGSICSTRIQTGHGVPTLQSVFDCASSEYAGTNAIIADGGIKTSGDIVKALAAGADAVMLGSLLAGAEETPGEIIYKSGLPFKTYRGMASVEAQIDWRGHTSSVEGVATTIPSKGPLVVSLDSLVTGIRSGFSYSGAKSIAQLQTLARFIYQTSSGAHESATHIHNKR